MAGVTQRHRIRRQVLELLADSEDSARHVQLELARIQRRYLESVIDQCCSELSSPDRVHRIDLLEVDLGAFDFRDLERELPNRLKSAMRKALANQIEKQDSEARRRDHDPVVTSRLELVAFFAATGNLPWWADYSNPRLVPEALDALLENAPDRLTDVLRTIVRDRAQLLRIVLHCEDEMLSALVRLLISDSPASSTELQQQTETILRAWGQVAGRQVTPGRNSFWTALIHHATFDVAVPMSSVSFWQQVLGGIDAQSHGAYVSVVTALLQVARSSGDSVPPPLTRLLQSILANRQGRVFINLPTEVQEELTQLLGKPSPPAGIESGVTSPMESTWDQATDTAAAAPPDRQSARSQSEMSRRKYRASRPREPLDLAFGDADTVYIENSGLVLFWPFLPRFFERLELVESDKFISDAAQHRAVGLLQYAVTEDPSPPEYQTALNKVLCGLDPAIVLEFGPPVTEKESEECATLLSSVIAQAPILRDMSIDGLRGSFLSRKGLLTARDGVWLLRVERETYDVVLDRIPWTLHWVRLPWMEAPLGVEW